MNNQPAAHQSTSSTPSRRGGAKGVIFVVAVLAFAGGTVLAMMLYGNIAQRKHEANNKVLKIADITESTIDPAEWGKNFPRQYDGYIRTADNALARFKWSEGRPPEETPPADAIHAGVRNGGWKAESKLASDPRLKTIFNGYAFAIDYRERRGHAFMLHDQRETERVKQKPQPGACLNCHASNVVAYREKGLALGAPGALTDPLTSETGQKQLFAGWEQINKLPYAEATSLVKHPVTCLDCHDPKTMALRITRPAFLEGVANLASSAEAVPHFPSIEQWRKGDKAKPYNPNDLASRQEMRSMSCGQCHVEYYFKGDEKRLTFPWHNGLRAEQMETYYNSVGWSDWTHKDSGAKVLKAQHPEFELWSQGIHARSGVSCADCHMPYKREGAMKFTDHQVQTPMSHVNLSCQTCHNYAESEIQSRVDQIQKRTKGALDRAEIAVVELINAIKEAKALGATDEQLKPARELQRQAQWRADFINAENSMGFHAPAESLRIVGEAVDFARQGITAVAKLKLEPATTATPTAGKANTTTAATPPVAPQ
jgi:nitrite reductase (cytochrome c-552)